MAKEQMIWLLWNSNVQCYYKPRIFRRVSDWIPCKESIGAIYAVHPSLIAVTSKSGSVIIPDSNGILDLESGMEYNVTLTSNGEKLVTSDLKKGKRIPIHSLAEAFRQRVGSEIETLSSAFYHNVWSDPDDKFRRLFTRNTTLEKAIENQSMWLEEVWGGPRKLYSETHGNDAVFKRMLGKHPRSIMTLHNTSLWIRNMNRALDTVVDDEVLKCNLRLYWGHFLGFFPFHPKQRGMIMKELKLWDSIHPNHARL